MDRLPDNPMNPAMPVFAERPGVCPEHGEFISRNLMRSIWSQCPACAERDRDAKKSASHDAARIAAQQRHRAMLDTACIPARFVGCTFASFHADTDEKRHAAAVARDFAEQFSEHSRKGAVLIFAGKPGTGKSHLAGAILQALLSPHVRYLTCMDMIRAVRETWRRDSEKSESQVLGYLQSLDLLVIDEIGMQYGTEGEQTILFDVLDRRYREVRPTILLTNQNKAGFKEFVGERTYDRLVETSRWIPFDWESYRAQARKAA